MKICIRKTVLYICLWSRFALLKCKELYVRHHAVIWYVIASETKWQKNPSSKIQDKWQRKFSGMPIYITFGMPLYLMLLKLRGQWQYRVSRVVIIAYK
jgi:hypothetical protein